MPSIDQLKGQACERTALKHFSHLGYEFVAQNVFLYGIEVDLIFKKCGVYYIVEVKSDNIWRMESPLSHSQRMRLEKASHLFSEYSQKPVRLWIAFVKKEKVRIYSLDGASVS